jgi:hypothetical protein
VLAIGVAQFLPALAQAEFYDRYLLVLLPATVVMAASWAPIRRTGWLAGVLALVLLAGASLEYTRMYVDRAKASWQLAEAMVRSGVPPEQINLGFEWDGTHLYLEAVQTLGLGFRFDLQRGYPWDPLTNHRYEMTEFDLAPGSGSDRTSYRSFLSRQRRSVRVIPLD